MNKAKTPVKIKLKTEIREQTDRQVTEVEATGYFFKQGNRSIVTYKEEQGEQNVTNLITITPDRVSVKRSGAVEMLQIFIQHQQTENVYRHQFGIIHIETYTEQITYQNPEPAEPGQLSIRYTTKLDGEGDRNHLLVLTIEEEAQ